MRRASGLVVVPFYSQGSATADNLVTVVNPARVRKACRVGREKV